MNSPLHMLQCSGDMRCDFFFTAKTNWFIIHLVCFEIVKQYTELAKMLVVLVCIIKVPISCDAAAYRYSCLSISACLLFTNARHNYLPINNCFHSMHMPKPWSTLIVTSKTTARCAQKMLCAECAFLNTRCGCQTGWKLWNMASVIQTCTANTYWEGEEEEESP